MAQFYGNLQGNRGEATRMGTKSSGISGHIRGWHIGVRVDCRYDEKTGEDICDVSVTGGSSNGSTLKHLGSFKRSDFGENNG